MHGLKKLPRPTSKNELPRWTDYERKNIAGIVTAEIYRKKKVIRLFLWVHTLARLTKAQVSSNNKWDTKSYKKQKYARALQKTKVPKKQNKGPKNKENHKKKVKFTSFNILQISNRLSQAFFLFFYFFFKFQVSLRKFTVQAKNLNPSSLLRQLYLVWNERSRSFNTSS